MESATKKAHLATIINHVFLPPKLPGGRDSIPIEEQLLEYVLSSLEEFKAVVDQVHHAALDVVMDALDHLKTVTPSCEIISAAGLRSLLSANNAVIPVFVAAQNAALIIRTGEPDVIIEAFELSPRNHAAMSIKGRLVRNFPGSCIAIPSSTLWESDFRAALSDALATMSTQSVPEMTPQVRKAGQKMGELRDTTDPTIVTGLLSKFLLAHGKQAETFGIKKNTREEVLLSPGHELPWRRSPVWLFIRVLLQLTLNRLSSEDLEPDFVYKRFMIFFMAQIQRLSLEHDLPTATIIVINAKIAQRLLKLRQCAGETWIAPVWKILSEAKNVAESRSRQIIAANKRSLNTSSFLHSEIHKDLHISLPELDNFIKSISTRTANKSEPCFRPESSFQHIATATLPRVWAQSAETTDQVHNLIAIEEWVDCNLDSWTANHSEGTRPCRMLSELILDYHKLAWSLYTDGPESTSKMLLTILELWIACDKGVIEQFPLVARYDPCIPMGFCQMLLLRSKRDLERLRRAEDYVLRGRWSSGIRRPILDTFGSPDSFAVTFFQGSSHHQNFKARIEEIANNHREAKVVELERLKAQHQSLVSKAAAQACKYTDDEYGRPKHAKGCGKCKFERQARGMTIEVYEWPLPSSETYAQATVFETSLPPEFSAWRDCTLALVTDILSYQHVEDSPPSPAFHLRSQEGLCNYFESPGHTHRVSLVSRAKPHRKTHRKNVKVASATQRDVCLPNGLIWELYDLGADRIITETKQSPVIYNRCIFRLPENMSKLQKYLRRTPDRSNDPRPNTVIANQMECPDDMTMAMYKDLCTMPLGYHVQWMSILTQLAMPSIDWKRPETLLFVWQIVEQTGPPAEDWPRVSHAALQEKMFIMQLLKHLELSLSRVEKNWESSKAVAVFSTIAMQVLSIGHPNGVRACLSFLERCRGVCLAWMRALKNTMQSTADEGQRAAFMDKCHEVALICAGCFDVGHHNLEHLLRNHATLADFLECSMTIEEMHRPLAPNDIICRTLTQRWQRCIHRIGHRLMRSSVTPEIAQALDIAISRKWEPFRRPGAQPWEVVSTCWVRTSAGSTAGTDTVPVHFNLLTAQLLVNGLPLSRFPSQYESHPSYRTLFKDCVLDCIPSTSPGMELQAGRRFNGNELHFGLKPHPSGRGKHDMLLSAIASDSIVELVPSRLFVSSLPYSFVSDYVHFYSAAMNCVHFRLKSIPWDASEKGWTLRRSEGYWQLRSSENVTLINPMSTVAQRCNEIFETLEHPMGLHIAFSSTDHLLSIRIPRLNLDFWTAPNSDFIFSTQFPRMHIDSCQDFDTLIGLKNKLVLCQDGDPSVRTVLIPEGEITVEAFGPGSPQEHSILTIDNAGIKVQAYQINCHLGVLEGSGSLQSKLFLAYLHALSSSPVPDPFTQHTGTEQSLSILRSGGVRSFDVLTAENIAILTRIASITPARDYYPRHLQDMQRIAWAESMCPLSQHGDFIVAVQELLSQAEDTAFLYPHISQSIPSLQVPNINLVKRDAQRCATFRTQGFGAEVFSTTFDEPYDSRDVPQDDRLTRVFETCTALLSSEIPTLDSSLDNRSTQLCDKLWSFLEIPSGTTGPSHAIPHRQFSYDKEWLNENNATLPDVWCRIHASIQRGAAVSNPVQIRLWISSLAFSMKVNRPILQALVGIVVSAQVRHVRIPNEDMFHLPYGAAFSRHSLENDIRQAKHPFKRCPEAGLVAAYNETRHQAADRRQRTWEENFSRAISATLDHFHNQWLSQEAVVQRAPTSMDTYIDQAKAFASTQAKFKKWKDNIAFKQYLQALAGNLDTIQKIGSCSSGPCHITFPQRPPCLPRMVNVATIFSLLEPPAILAQAPMDELIRVTTPSAAGSQSPLQSFLGSFKNTGKSSMETRYMEDLAESAASLCDQSEQYRLTGSQSVLNTVIVQKALDLKVRFDMDLQTLKQLLAMPDPGCQAAETQERMRLRLAATTHQWPRWSTRTILQQLNQKHRKSLPDAWRSYLIVFAKRLETVQWAQRLVALRYQDADLLKELRNHGSSLWDRDEHIDSLLIEVESNLRIRSIQGEIAHTMRDPPDGANASVQLNMGEGKSSLIVPIVAVSLADGTRLVRVIVAKPQSKQMLEMLVSKMGGLVDRQIFHLPFSRTTQLNSTQAQVIHRHCEACISSGGILLVQPEHLLSLQLMTVDSIYSGDVVLGNQLLEIRNLFMEKARDIVDESDENFSPKFELIYTIGHQQSIEYAPQRWVIIHEILAHVSMVAAEIKKQIPNSLEVGLCDNGTFPRVRILDEAGQEALLDTMAAHICQNGLCSFPVARQPQEIRKAILPYIRHCNLTKEQIDAVELSAFWTPTTRDTLLLLRGLLAKGILAFALGSKRWRVHYGLDPNRSPETKLVVPYRAKDSPSTRSEFSHPDIVIILTSLSYYYGGLSDRQLFQTMHHLRRSTQGAEEYQVWVSLISSMPAAFRHLEGINLRDEIQCENEVFPHLKQSKSTIDYFLSHLVFTKEMKEFPYKLSASGWDIGAVKQQPTTGFSGTNDSRHLLPLDVKQLDLRGQRHTNALVLTNILQPCNSVALMPELSSQFDGHGMATLRRINAMDPPTRVILDVGAQIIDLNNQEVATAWLEINAVRPDIGAVIFCNENDDVCVLDRHGHIEHLLISPFRKNMDACLVFLDEAHTRGIDLRLPQNYRAAVTLGANLTKDRLVQACMRMRKLDSGQSLVFCVPAEVELKIRSLMPQSQMPIEIMHVLRWAISETLSDLKRTMPIWANQGQCFNRQNELWKQVTQGQTMDRNLADKFLDEDAPSLDKRYRPGVDTAPVIPNDKATDIHTSRIAQRCEDFEVHDFESAALQEEQERELEPEAEQERQVERPPPAQPAEHHVHRSVRRFVETGFIHTAGNAFLPAFESLARTTAAERFSIAQFPADLWVTADFARTVQDSGLRRTSLDAFQQDVRWILTTQGGKSEAMDMVVISPYEADQLLLSIKRSSAVRLHIYAPRQNQGYAPIDHLSLYVLPLASSLRVLPFRPIVELNLFAGQLYFDSFAEYTRVCDFLCLSWSATERGMQVGPDGFIAPQHRQGPESSWNTFEESPTPFLRVLLGKIRRQCDGIVKTDMGRLLEGAVLLKSDFEDEDER